MNEETKLLVKLLFDKYGKIIVNSKEASEIIGKSVISLQQDRKNEIGIPYSKLGVSIRYDLIDIAKYIQDMKIKG